MCYSFKEINTTTELLHLSGLDKRMASFEKSKTLPPQSCHNLGECPSQFLTPCAIEFGYFYSNDTQRGGCLHMLHSINKYLTVKHMDNLISQSSTGGKLSFCEPKLAILQVSVHASVKPAHCNHMMEKLLSDWLKCVLKCTHSNQKRHRSIWLQRLCEYLKLSNILVKTSRIIPKILRGVLKIQ